MMASIYSAVSGVSAQATKLDVIANNIANVSTTGYKQQNVTFSDLLSQTISGATGSSATRGGTNAVQLGLGVAVASTSIDFTAGTAQSTGVGTDVSIGGTGFFIVSGGTEGKYQFTRDGSFDVDEDGNLTVNGYLVNGWLSYTENADGTYSYDTSKDISAINIYSDIYNGDKSQLAAEATTKATLTGTLDPSADANSNATALNSIGELSQTTTIKSNSTGASVSSTTGLTDSSVYTVTLKDSTVTSGNFDITLTDADGNVVATLTDEDLSDGATLTGTNGETVVLGASDSATAGTMKFTSATDWTTSTSVTAYDSKGTSYDLSVNFAKCYYDSTTGTTSWYYDVTSTSDGVTSVTGSGYLLFDSDGKLITDNGSYSTTPSITVATDEGSDITMTLDMSGLLSQTQDDEDDMIVSVSSVDGCAAGTLTDISIGSDGVITGTYSNGETRPLAMIALATFQNEGGLEKIGDNLYVQTANTGTFKIVAAGAGGTGTLSTGTLEMSNVDLSGQFSEMMITERAYQANTKVITASDECLQTLINMI
ncbi:hypothetical protein P22_2357 [Propionispora sp. 2/2-37]|uniref:flagellar hook protein FlgE n=1 Tax=Propionispora sp. 2/2-37 TaxID=1677858 RepID=UPI0006BB647C|nr:flagellar hook-basal body complex protein [Propionispora sp. 2/2-37]CUH96267.1 hypothetical protein P22_2357 [Propionispora sp. 2/2-37]